MADGADDMAGTGNDTWKLDRRVSVTMLLLLIGNIALGAWWAAEINTRVLAIEKEAAHGPRFTKDDGRDLRRELAALITAHVRGGPHDEVSERLARMEAKMDQLAQNGQRREEWLRRVRDEINAVRERLSGANVIGPPR